MILECPGHGVVVAYIYGVDAAAVQFRLARVKTTTIRCAFCKSKFVRPIGRYREAIKFKWKQYCSPSCKHKIKIRAKEFKCGNPNCSNTVFKTPSDIRRSISGRMYCSQTCAAIYNNHNRAKYNTCKRCGKTISSWNKYCSSKCAADNRKKSLDQTRFDAIARIRKFYKSYKRIPVKREMYGLYRTARIAFGSWNKAVEASGFDPNPVLFAKRFVANDGHACDSFAEKVIDDWLLENNVLHERHYPYSNPRFTADFKIGDNTFVEYFGLAGVQRSYDEIILKKRAMSDKSGIRLIELYPKDIYPTSKLKNILDRLIEI